MGPEPVDPRGGLAWFDQLPTRDRRSTKAASTTTTTANLKPTTTSKTTTSKNTVPSPAPDHTGPLGNRERLCAMGPCSVPR
jgi:hypothetical protein